MTSAFAHHLQFSEQTEIFDDLAGWVYQVAPPAWKSIKIVYSAVGDYAEYTTSVMLADGSSTLAWDPGKPLMLILNALRNAHEIAGSGSWYSCEIIYKYHGSWDVEIDAENEPAWQEPPIPADYRRELERFEFEAEKIPAWLRAGAGLGAPEAAASAPTPTPAPGPQQEQSTFRRAAVFDGRNEEGGPPVVHRPRLDPAEAGRVLAYLTAGEMILFARSYEKDAFFPDNPPAVPLTFETDGTWIWPGAVRYYLEKYGLPPEADFLAHIRANDFTMPDVSQEVKTAARDAVLGGGVEPTR